jgi:hypothetical protein
MRLVPVNFVLLTAEQIKQLLINDENYFHKRAKGTRSSNVTVTAYCGKRVTLVELRIFAFFEVVNIP